MDDFLLRSRMTLPVTTGTPGVPVQRQQTQQNGAPAATPFRQMLERMLERLRETDAALAVCIAWKINGFVPLADNLTGCGFQYITDSHLVWYDHEDLVCPYCKGRCKCDAAVYYKMLERGGFD